MSEQENIWASVGKIVRINLLICLVLSSLAGIAEGKDSFLIALGLTTVFGSLVNFLLLLVALVRKGPRGKKYGYLLSTIILPLIGFSSCLAFPPAPIFLPPAYHREPRQ